MHCVIADEQVQHAGDRIPAVVWVYGLKSVQSVQKGI